MKNHIFRNLLVFVLLKTLKMDNEEKAKKHDQAVLLSTIENDEYHDFIVMVLGMKEIDKDVLLCRLATANFDKNDHRSFHQQVESILRKHFINSGDNTSSHTHRRLLNAKRSNSDTSLALPDPTVSSDDDVSLTPPSPIVDGQIFCTLCGKFFVSENFSARMQKADKDNQCVDEPNDLQLVYCLKHTSTSSFNDSYKEGTKPGVIHVNLASDEPAKDQYSRVSNYSCLQAVDFTCDDDDEPVKEGRKDAKRLKKVLDEPIDLTEIENVYDYDGNGNLLIYGQQLKKYYEREGLKYATLYKTWYTKMRRYNEDKIRSESAIRGVEKSNLNEDEQRHTLIHHIVMEQYKKYNPDYVESSSEEDDINPLLDDTPNFQDEDGFKLSSEKPQKPVIIDDSDDDTKECLLPSGYRNQNEEEIDKMFTESLRDECLEGAKKLGTFDEGVWKDLYFQEVSRLVPLSKAKLIEECKKNSFALPLCRTESLMQRVMREWLANIGTYKRYVQKVFVTDKLPNASSPHTPKVPVQSSVHSTIMNSLSTLKAPSSVQNTIMNGLSTLMSPISQSFSEDRLPAKSAPSSQNVFAIDHLPNPASRRSSRIAKEPALPAEPPKIGTVQAIYSRGIYNRNTNILEQK